MTDRMLVLRLWNGLAFAAAPLLLALLGYRRRWVTDDAFISFRVVDNLLHGHGPVFNVDERVEAHTNPLWVALLALWALLGGRIEVGAGVALGILLSVLGLALAQLAATRLAGRRAAADRQLLLPFGALVFAALPVAWDFVTSGLETGLTFAWLGTAYWTLTRTAIGGGACRARGALTTAVVLGLGLLVRPDLAVFSAVLFGALLACLFISGWLRAAPGRVVALVAGFAAIPAGYQLFRMGYYAALVPTTVLAKATGGARWSLGWDYLVDFVQPYTLWLPLGILLATVGFRLRQSLRRSDLIRAILLAAPPLAACLHALAIIRVGGDFMHGRLLLPSLFAFMLPVAVLWLPTRRPARPARWAPLAAALAVVIWGCVAALELRVPPKEPGEPVYAADERAFYVLTSGNPHPVTLDDYASFDLPWLRQGRAWHSLAAQHVRLLVIDPAVQIMRNEIPPPANAYPLRPGISDAIVVVAPAWNIGMTGYAAGPQVHVVDRYGLADQIAARVEPELGARAGHARKLRMTWVIARYADPTADAPFPPDVAAARAALRCPELAELLAAVEEPLTPGRFVRNLWKSWRLTWLRVPSDPAVAATVLCGH